MCAKKNANLDFWLTRQRERTERETETERQRDRDRDRDREGGREGGRERWLGHGFLKKMTLSIEERGRFKFELGILIATQPSFSQKRSSEVTISLILRLSGKRPLVNRR